MYSLSKEAYAYYKALIGQYNNDGGTYTPVPSSPPSNIDNGGLGYFQVSAVHDINPF